MYVLRERGSIVTFLFVDLTVLCKGIPHIFGYLWIVKAAGEVFRKTLKVSFSTSEDTRDKESADLQRNTSDFNSVVCHAYQ